MGKYSHDSIPSLTSASFVILFYPEEQRKI